MKLTHKMKLLAALAVVVLMAVCSPGVEAEEYLQNGKKWIVEDYNLMDKTSVYFTFAVAYDTIAYDKVQKKVDITYPDDPIYETIIEWGYTFCLLREDNGRIYGTKVLETSSIENIYIDYSVKPGDVVSGFIPNSAGTESIASYEYRVINERTIELYGFQRRLLTLRGVSPRGTEYDFYWIEGIGAHRPNSILNNDYLYNWGSYNTNVFKGISECYLDDQLLYSRDDFDKILAEYDEKNGLSGLDRITIDGNNEDSDQAIYDLMGRKVANPIRNNIYVRNGKKIIW